MIALAEPVSLLCDQRCKRPLRVAVICDFREEEWPSMDLVGDMLINQFATEQSDWIDAQRIQPRMPQPFGSTRGTKNFHRLLGRFITYPREIRNLRDFDLFHIVDHSYAHLALELPRDRVVITCHDADAFSAALPGSKPSKVVRRALSQRALKGLRNAAWVICDTEATRQQLLSNNLVSNARSSVAHNGVHPGFCANPDGEADKTVAKLLGRAPGESPEVLHVGSTIARKRIQDVLGIFAKVRAEIPELRLLRVGGVFTNEQQQLVRQLNLEKSIDVLPPVDTPILAALYRRASVLIQPSEAEGFGLPVIEAMACGTPVVASDIPALREVGGDAAEYCMPGDVACWAKRLSALLKDANDSATRKVRSQMCIKRAAQFSWNDYARQVVDIYNRVLAW